ncbi:hypothetical protein ACFUTV_35745 [Streptomyces sp. NPDC057298]|uniref:hypothetical protein n=1 Tax=Streptomyces sp. NPDC057298 TaxID=3346091 RepID=UPI003632BD4E
MPTPDYPHLGFNPVPGSTDTVSGLHKKLADCAKVLADTRDLVTKLMDGSYWKGDAAVAFREQLDGGPLPLNLKNAARSIGKAAKQLSLWEGELDDFQRRAKRLDEEAKDARAVVDAAKGKATTAGDDPALNKKKGAAHEDAEKALTQANTAVDEAEADLEKILGRARTLAEEHENQAQYRAGKIRDATKKLAPHEPGAFDSAVDWVKENLPDILSFMAGVIGLVAIIFAGPLGVALVAALMLTASALSASALGLRIAQDPEMWASLQDGFTKGEFDADFFSSLVTVGSDVMGAIPGLGAVAVGSRGAVNAIRAGGEAVSIGQKAGVFGSKIMEGAQGISQLENPLSGWLVRGASDTAKAERVVAATSSAIGVGTAGFGLVNSLVDADDDGIKDGSVAGIDGTRLILDNAGILNLVGHVF